VPAIQISDDLRLIAEERAAEAQVLLGGGHDSGAYYLAGYGVECALKAVLTRDLTAYGMPDFKAVRDAYIHDLEKLADDAGVAGALAGDPVVGPSWLIAKGWSETSRYRLIAHQDAVDLVTSVADPNSGVLQWLKQYW
jgi:hypothetical protein